MKTAGIIGIILLVLTTGCGKVTAEDTPCTDKFVATDTTSTDTLSGATAELPPQVHDIVNPGSDIDAWFTLGNIPDSIFNMIDGVSYHADGPVKRNDLRYLRVLHYDFDGNVRVGELICNKSIAAPLRSIFKELYEAQYPIEKLTVIDNYGGDDEASMRDNNSSCFNCRRTTAGGRLSKHAYGTAIDINPLYNPYVHTSRKGKRTIAPAGSEPYTDRAKKRRGMIVPGDACHKAFLRHGFSWGGNWRSSKDYQHFEKK